MLSGLRSQSQTRTDLAEMWNTRVSQESECSGIFEASRAGELLITLTACYSRQSLHLNQTCVLDSSSRHVITTWPDLTRPEATSTASLSSLPPP